MCSIFQCDHLFPLISKQPILFFVLEWIKVLEEFCHEHECSTREKEMLYSDFLLSTFSLCI